MFENLEKILVNELVPDALKTYLAEDMPEFRLSDGQFVMFLPLIDPLPAPVICACMNSSSAERLRLLMPLTTVENKLDIIKDQLLSVRVRTHAMHENRVHVHYSLGDGDMHKAEAFLRHVVAAMTAHA